MNKRATVLGLLVVLLSSFPAAAAPPTNDTVDGALTLGPLPVAFSADTSEATLGPNEDHCGTIAPIPAKGIWYRMEFPELASDDANAVVLDIQYAATEASLSLWVPSGDIFGVPTMSRISCVYPDDWYPEWIWSPVVYLSVSTLPVPGSRPIDIRIRRVNTVGIPNDTPYRATRIHSLPYVDRIDATAATPEDDPECGESYVWYSYRPPAPEHLEIVVDGEDRYADRRISVFEIGDETTALSCVLEYSKPARALVDVRPGTEVLIGIGGPSQLTFTVRRDARRGADARADAMALRYGETLEFTTAGATLEPGEPAGCGLGGSVWYALPARARSAEIQLTGDVFLAAVDDDGIVSCTSDGHLTIPRESTATHLRIRVPGEVTGTIRLHFSPPVGVAVSGPSPLPEGCGDESNLVYVDAEVEVHQAVNPNDPDHLVMTWQQDRYNDRGGARGIGAGVSFDGGQTWQTSILPRQSVCTGGKHQRATDPWAAVDADGTAYIMTLAFDPGLGNNVYLGSSILISRSEDGGITWSDPITVATSPGVLFNDKETLTADPNTPGLLYAVWNISPAGAAAPVFARSEDGGRTWTPPTPVPVTGSGAGDQIAVLGDGTLVAVANRGGSVKSVTSRDRGRTWSSESVVSTNGATGREGPGLIRGGAYLPSVATDGTSVFVSWSDTYSAFFARSDDAGATWRVAEAGSASAEPTRFMTAVAATDDGTLAVLDYVTDGAFNVWVAMATSRDGGLTWTEAPVTDDFSLWTAPFSKGRGYFFGDYFAVSPSRGGLVAAIVATTPGGPTDVHALHLVP